MVVPLIPIAIGAASLAGGLFAGSKLSGDTNNVTDNTQYTTSTINTYQTSNTTISDSRVDQITVGMEASPESNLSAEQKADQTSGLLTEQTLNYVLIFGGLYAGYRVYKELN